MVVLLAIHSSLHCFAVLTFAAGLGATVGAGLGALAVGLAAGAAPLAACPRHSATNAFFVFPLAWMAALFAVHSSLHCLTVFCCAAAGMNASASIVAEQIRTPTRRSIAESPSLSQRTGKCFNQRRLGTFSQSSPSQRRTMAYRPCQSRCLCNIF
jgi:hypothetical protein